MRPWYGHIQQRVFHFASNANSASVFERVSYRLQRSPRFVVPCALFVPRIFQPIYCVAPANHYSKSLCGTARGEGERGEGRGGYIAFTQSVMPDVIAHPFRHASPLFTCYTSRFTPYSVFAHLLADLCAEVNISLRLLWDRAKSAAKNKEFKVYIILLGGSIPRSHVAASHCLQVGCASLSTKRTCLP